MNNTITKTKFEVQKLCMDRMEFFADNKIAFTYITKEDDDAAAKMVEEGKVEAWLDHIGSEITIDATVKTEQDVCTVKIAGGHTDIYYIERNGEIIEVENVQKYKNVACRSARQGIYKRRCGGGSGSRRA